MLVDMPSTEAKRRSIFDELVSILYTDIHPANNVPHSPLVLSMPYINSFGKRFLEIAVNFPNAGCRPC